MPGTKSSAGGLAHSARKASQACVRARAALETSAFPTVLYIGLDNHIVFNTDYAVQGTVPHFLLFNAEVDRVPDEYANVVSVTSARMPTTGRDAVAFFAKKGSFDRLIDAALASKSAILIQVPLARDDDAPSAAQFELLHMLRYLGAKSRSGVIQTQVDSNTDVHSRILVVQNIASKGTRSGPDDVVRLVSTFGGCTSGYVLQRSLVPVVAFGKLWFRAGCWTAGAVCDVDFSDDIVAQKHRARARVERDSRRDSAPGDGGDDEGDDEGDASLETMRDRTLGAFTQLSDSLPRPRAVSETTTCLHSQCPIPPVAMKTQEGIEVTETTKTPRGEMIADVTATSGDAAVAAPNTSEAHLDEDDADLVHDAGRADDAGLVDDASDPTALIDDLALSAPVVLIGRSTCPHCVRATDALRRDDAVGQGLRVVDIEQTDQGEQIRMALRGMGHNTVPQVFVNGVHIGGADDTLHKLRTGDVRRRLMVPRDDPLDAPLF